MINWDETKRQLGREDLSGNNPKVIMQCDECGVLKGRTIKVKGKVINGQMPWICIKCNCQKPEVKANRSKASREKIQKIKEKISKALTGRKRESPTKETRDKISEASKASWKKNHAKFMKSFNGAEYKASLSTRMKEQWLDNEYRAARVQSSLKLWSDDDFKKKMLTIFNSDEYRNNLIKSHNTIEFINKMKEVGNRNWSDSEYSSRMKDIFDSPEYRSSISKAMIDKWTDEEYRMKMRAVYDSEEFKAKMRTVNENMPKVSSIQIQLYSVLDDLGIKYYREYNDKEDDLETKIGPYSFDCVIPLKEKTLLIECQGDYWHSSDKAIIRDRQKSSYISNNLPNHEVKHLWEHEFKCRVKIIELIKYWTGKTQFELIEYDFDEVLINRCHAKDYRLLLSKYHYLSNAGKGGIAFGAILNNELIAVCVFSPLGRQNMPWNKNTTRELSRLCIHPRYQKRNFASWFVSRCLKQLDSKYKTVISYCDTTFNHDGAVYKACNFILDGEVKPDYWYVSNDGWVMHKKTLYNHAVSMKMTEKEFANYNGYTKTYGDKKLRFVFSR
jgi:hypothetical protein